MVAALGPWFESRTTLTFYQLFWYLYDVFHLSNHETGLAANEESVCLFMSIITMFYFDCAVSSLTFSQSDPQKAVPSISVVGLNGAMLWNHGMNTTMLPIFFVATIFR